MIYLQSLAALLAVLCLVWLLYRVFLQFQGRLGLGGGQRRIRVLERSPLGDKRSLLLVEVQSQRFLVGSTSQNLTLLAELEAAEGEHTAAAAESEEGDPDGFPWVLKESSV